MAEARLLKGLVEVVRESGKIVQDHWSKPRRVEHKGRIDLVTATDKAVEQDLKERLAKLLPGSDFLAEESAAEAGVGDLTWVIDPVDGTTNFAHGYPMLAISVGLWTGDHVELGVIYNPIFGELFSAGRGLGAWLGEQRINVSRTDTLVDSLMATGFPYTIREDLDEVMERLRRVLGACQGVRRAGAAAIDLAYTAAGRLDGYYELGLWPWDTAAGWVLVEEAGGRVTQLDGTPYALGANGILASNGRIHDDLLRLFEAL